jgi:hypothetical protein
MGFPMTPSVGIIIYQSRLTLQRPLWCWLGVPFPRNLSRAGTAPRWRADEFTRISVVPTELGWFFARYPALKRGAKFGRPSGAGLADLADCEDDGGAQAA